MQYGFAIDIQRCIGCHTCAIACHVENNLPKGIWWNRIMTEGGAEMDTPSGLFPLAKMTYLPVMCQHCANPACVKVCPVGATYKDDKTGVVRQDYDKCIGCRMCMAACPYTGVRSYNWEEPKHIIGHQTGSLDVPPHQKHVVEKCTLCWHKIAKGQQPECTITCPERARTFGDFDDPNSEVSKYLATHQWKQLLPEKGTDPSVYDLI